MAIEIKPRPEPPPAFNAAQKIRIGLRGAQLADVALELMRAETPAIVRAILASIHVAAKVIENELPKH